MTHLQRMELDLTTRRKQCAPEYLLQLLTKFITRHKRSKAKTEEQS